MSTIDQLLREIRSAETRELPRGAPSGRWFNLALDPTGDRQVARLDAFGYVGEEISADAFGNELDALGDLDEIQIRLNSPGGFVSDGVAIYTMLQQHPAAVRVEVVGLAASMASLIAMSADEGQLAIAQSASMMVHNAWAISVGDHRQMRVDAELLERTSATLAGVYARRTGLDVNAVRDLMDTETWFMGPEAVESRFADSVLSDDPAAIAAAASLRTSVYYLRGHSSMPPSNPSPEAAARAEGARIARQEEQSRRDAIASMFAAPNFAGNSAITSLRQACMDDMSVSAEVAGQRLLAHLGRYGAEHPPEVAVTPINSNGPGWGTEARAGDRRSDLHHGAVDGLLLRAGVPVKDPHPASRDFRDMTLTEIARATLSSIGRPSSGSPDKVFRAALDATDFPALLEDVADKAMITGWDMAEIATHREWTRPGSAQDFRPTRRVLLSQAPDLERVLEGGEYRSGPMSDAGTTLQLSTYGKIVQFTRQSLINDELSAFTDAINAFAQSAARLEADLCYASLVSNPNTYDDLPLFDASHNNTVTAADSTPSVATLSSAREKMRLQRGLARPDGTEGQFLNLRPAIIVVPVALETPALEVVSAVWSTRSETNAQGQSSNPFAGMIVVADPRLDADSRTTWYVVANPAVHGWIERLTLRGNDVPAIFQDEGFTRDVMAWKCRHDFAAGVLDYRGVVRVEQS